MNRAGSPSGTVRRRERRDGDREGDGTDAGLEPGLEERADEPDRFADLVPALRAYAQAAVEELSAPEPPTYCHWDYRWGNLLVDPDTGATEAVLDWANLAAIEPAYTLAKTEFHMVDGGDAERDGVAAAHRDVVEAYV